MTDYEKQANNFLKLTETEVKIEFLKNGFHFEDDIKPRDIYKITLTKANRKFSFNFGNSLESSGEWIGYNFEGGKIITNKKEYKKFKEKYGNIHKNKKFKIPTSYDVLSCLTTSEVSSFEDFCLEYGYDNDSIKAEKTYKAVLKEYNNLKMLFSDEEINQLQEIN